jgi:hypothetical protein
MNLHRLLWLLLEVGRMMISMIIELLGLLEVCLLFLFPVPIWLLDTSEINANKTQMSSKKSNSAMQQWV